MANTCRQLIAKTRVLNDLVQIFTCSLGFLLPEARYLDRTLKLGVGRARGADYEKLWRYFAGIRLLAEHLAGIPVDKDVLESLEKIRESLISQILLISADKNRHCRHYSRIFLEYMAITALTKILPRYYVTVILYKKVQRISGK